MTIQYSSSPREIAMWYWYSLRHNRRHLRAWILSLLAVGVVVFLSERQSGTTSTPKAIGISIVAAIALALFFAVYPQLRFKPEVRTLTISPERISTTINSRSKSYPWSEVASVIEEPDHIYIRFTNVNAFVVPFRAFSSLESREEFVQRCREWYDAGVGRPAA